MSDLPDTTRLIDVKLPGHENPTAALAHQVVLVNNQFLQIKLRTLPKVFASRGVYPEPDGDSLPKRFRHVHEEAWSALVSMEEDYPGAFHYSDLLRSPEASLLAVRAGRGASRPGRSHHNFGGAADHDLSGNRSRLQDLGVSEMQDNRWKLAYDELCASYGFLCHRKDGELGSEAWHYGIGLSEYDRSGDRTRYGATQRWIDAKYGWWRSAMVEDPRRAQIALHRLRLYRGDVDGFYGPLTREATRAFQRTWGLPVTSTLDTETLWTLSVVAADFVLAP